MNREEIIKAFMFRHACKEFDDTKKISDEDFATILESGRLSPSSFGFEPWHFLIIQNPELREEFLPLFWGGKRQFPTASHLIFTLAKKSYFMHYGSSYIQHMMRNVHHLPEDVVEIMSQFYKTFQEHDFELIDNNNDSAMTAWSIAQTYIALGNMMTTAALLGIDSCPIEGFYKRAINQMLADKLKIDLNQYTIAYALALGYRHKEPREKTRQALSDIVTWY